MTKTEAERIAAAIHEARPDWPAPSILSFLAKDEVRNKPYRDTFVALAWLAADPRTITPGRLLEAGPWWRATQAEASTPIPVGVCPECKKFRRDCQCLEGAVPLTSERAAELRALIHTSRDTGRTERADDRSRQENR